MDKRKSAIIQIIAFSVTAVVLCGVLVLGLFNKNFSLFNFNNGYHYEDSDKYTAGNGELPPDNIKNIDINWVSGTINISAYDGDTVKITETSSKPLEEKDKMRYYVNNGKLIIQYMNIKRNFNYTKNKNLEVLVPSNVANELLSLNIDTVSSDTNITDINAHSMNFDSASGDFTVTGFVATEIEFDTVSGNVTSHGVAEDVEFDSMSGNFNYESDVCPKKISTDCISGSVTIAVPDNNGITFDKDTISGDFSSDFDITWKDKKGIYKNGENDFSFNSLSGNITVNKK